MDRLKSLLIHEIMGDMEFTFENFMDWNRTTDATQSLAENYAYLARFPLPYSPDGQSCLNFYTKQMEGRHKRTKFT